MKINTLLFASVFLLSSGTLTACKQVESEKRKNVGAAASSQLQFSASEVRRRYDVDSEFRNTAALLSPQLKETEVTRVKVKVCNARLGGGNEGNVIECDAPLSETCQSVAKNISEYGGVLSTSYVLTASRQGKYLRSIEDLNWNRLNIENNWHLIWNSAARIGNTNFSETGQIQDFYFQTYSKKYFANKLVSLEWASLPVEWGCDFDEMGDCPKLYRLRNERNASKRGKLEYKLDLTPANVSSLYFFDISAIKNLPKHGTHGLHVVEISPTEDGFLISTYVPRGSTQIIYRLDLNNFKVNGLVLFPECAIHEID